MTGPLNPPTKHFVCHYDAVKYINYNPSLFTPYLPCNRVIITVQSGKEHSGWITDTMVDVEVRSLSGNPLEGVDISYWNPITSITRIEDLVKNWLSQTPLRLDEKTSTGLIRLIIEYYNYDDSDSPPAPIVQSGILLPPLRTGAVATNPTPISRADVWKRIKKIASQWKFLK